jgi:cytochrome c biogenesis protein CcmG/thiol:disulfide interchange protein DsbE
MTFAKTPRLAAIALTAMLAITACGGSEADDSATASAADSAESEGSAESEAATPAAPAVLQTSPSLDVVGDALVPFADPNNDPAVGVVAPVITGQSFDGTDVTIGGETDGPTMLVFLAHWCPHCNDEIPELVKLREAGTLPENLNIIGISTAVADDRENFPPSEWIVDKDWTWPVLADTDTAEAFLAYGGTGFPYTVMLFPDGSVSARKSGNESADRILEWIESSLLI